MNREIWKPIEKVQGRYEVSNMGQVRNAQSGNVLSPRKLPYGYQRVHLGANHRDEYVHRLVAEAFCKRDEGCNVVNHIDNNTENNRADNLEWTTQRKNVHHAMKQGRVHGFPNAKDVIGEKDGVVYRFSSTYEAALFANCDPKTVWRSCNMGTQTMKGYRWKWGDAS